MSEDFGMSESVRVVRTWRQLSDQTSEASSEKLRTFDSNASKDSKDLIDGFASKDLIDTFASEYTFYSDHFIDGYSLIIKVNS